MALHSTTATVTGVESADPMVAARDTVNRLRVIASRFQEKMRTVWQGTRQRG
jgi:hypothetical protein